MLIVEPIRIESVATDATRDIKLIIAIGLVFVVIVAQAFEIVGVATSLKVDIHQSGVLPENTHTIQQRIFFLKCPVDVEVATSGVLVTVIPFNRRTIRRLRKPYMKQVFGDISRHFWRGQL